MVGHLTDKGEYLIYFYRNERITILFPDTKHSRYYCQKTHITFKTWNCVNSRDQS